jgi:hypothetical protein
MNTKRKIALFERVGSPDWKSCWWADVDQSDDDADEGQPDGYVRISPYVEVEFAPLPQGPVIEKQLEVLARAEQKIREEFQQQLNKLNDTRQKLLALSFQPAA